jgi:hypothetical protein
MHDFQQLEPLESKRKYQTEEKVGECGELEVSVTERPMVQT